MDIGKLNNKKILILDDEVPVCSLIKDILEGLELDISDANSLKEAWEVAEETKFDLLILDYNVSDGTGWSMTDKISRNPEKYGIPAYILMSGTVDVTLWKKNSDKPNTEFMAKPFSVAEMRDTVIKLLQ